MDFITTLLEENGYMNETLFLKAMEKLGLVKSRRAEEEFMMFLVDPRVGAESLFGWKKELSMNKHLRISNPKWVLLLKLLGLKGSYFTQKNTKRFMCIC